MKKITVWATDGGDIKVESSGLGVQTEVQFLKEIAGKLDFRDKVDAQALADAANSDPVSGEEE